MHSFARSGHHLAGRLAAFTLAALLSACGGGGGDSGGADTPAQPTSSKGKFVDGPVQGLDYYVNGVKIGTTDAAGEFLYTSGQQVTFKVGNVTLGTAVAANLSTVTPADLTASMGSLTNILILLQSLDADSNPANGITISASRAAALTTANDLSAPGSTLASISTDLPGLSLVGAAAANTHFVTGLIANGAPNALTISLVDAMVGFWHFQCDGKGYSQVAELRKVASNRLHVARNIGRQYANANCTGAYTSVPEFGGQTQQDYVTVLNAMQAADGTATVTTSWFVADTGSEVAIGLMRVSADRNTMTDQGADPWPGSIARTSAFAFP